VAKIANAALTLKRGNAVVVQAEVTPIDHRCPAEWLAGRTAGRADVAFRSSAEYA